MNKSYIKCGDCLELMNEILDKSIDMILCDLPYGKTHCKWDRIIPFEILWKNYNRIIKDNGAIVLFGIEPFSSELIHSNLKYFKYNWIWQKDKATGHLNAKKQPMRETEIISVFYKNQCTYNPQLYEKDSSNIRAPRKKRNNVDIYGSMEKEVKRSIPINMGYPKDILKFRSCSADKGKTNHPTEKPVPLLEYLIKTYTNEGETVLDNCMGSGSTCVAAINTNRNFIGFEKEQKFFEVAKKRIEESKCYKQQRLI